MQKDDELDLPKKQESPPPRLSSLSFFFLTATFHAYRALLVL